MISKMGYSKRGGKLSSCPDLPAAKNSSAAAEPGAPPQLLSAHCGRISSSAQGRQVSGCWSSLIARGPWQMPRRVSKLKWMHVAGREEWEEGGREGTGLRGTWRAAARAEGSIPGACRQQGISRWPAHHLKAGALTLSSMGQASRQPSQVWMRG